MSASDLYTIPPEDLDRSERRALSEIKAGNGCWIIFYGPSTIKVRLEQFVGVGIVWYVDSVWRGPWGEWKQESGGPFADPLDCLADLRRYVLDWLARLRAKDWYIQRGYA